MALPSTIFNSDGFIFPQGQSTIIYNGITITNQIATRSYGGPSGKTETGNIGFAQVTFGDSRGNLTTNTVTVFLYYLVTETRCAACRDVRRAGRLVRSEHSR
jgi:hypothetical protein